MKAYLVLGFAFVWFMASCTAPSGHKSQSWQPKPAKRQQQGRNR